MSENQTPNTELEIAMPRREFIRKSLIASGGVFVGMTTLGNVSLPELSSSYKPKQPSSGTKSGGNQAATDVEVVDDRPGWKLSD